MNAKAYRMTDIPAVKQLFFVIEALRSHLPVTIGIWSNSDCISKLSGI